MSGRSHHDGVGADGGVVNAWLFLVKVASQPGIRSGRAGGLLLLLENPGELARLRQNLDLVPKANRHIGSSELALTGDQQHVGRT